MMEKKINLNRAELQKHLEYCSSTVCNLSFAMSFNTVVNG